MLRSESVLSLSKRAECLDPPTALVPGCPVLIPHCNNIHIHVSYHCVVSNNTFTNCKMYAIQSFTYTTVYLFSRNLQFQCLCVWYLAMICVQTRSKQTLKVTIIKHRFLYNPGLNSKLMKLLKIQAWLFKDSQYL